MNRRYPQLLSLALIALILTATCAAEDVEEGSISAEQERYASRKGAEQFVPKSGGFTWKMMPIERMPQYQAFLLTFPSPLKSQFPENNTVYAEYYRPVGKKGIPGVVVLHILGGDFEISRLLSRHLASRGIGALFVQMAYYGHRRPKGRSRGKMLTEDMDRTLKAVTQTVMDVRRAGLWLSLRPEVDGEKIGIAGTSLGAFIASLSAGADPRFKKCALVLGGGDIAKVIWEGTETAKFRKKLEQEGFTYESLAERLRAIEPLAYAGNIDGRGVLMVNARNDSVVPSSCTMKLWEKMGKPKILWYNRNHYTMLTYLFDVLVRVSEHFDKGKWDLEKEKTGE